MGRAGLLSMRAQCSVGISPLGRAGGRFGCAGVVVAVFGSLRATPPPPARAPLPARVRVRLALLRPARPRVTLAACGFGGRWGAGGQAFAARRLRRRRAPYAVLVFFQCNFCVNFCPPALPKGVLSFSVLSVVSPARPIYICKSSLFF